MPVATWRTGPNCQTANASPMTMISAKIRRRTSRSRVLATGDSSPPTTRCERPFPCRASMRSTTSATTTAATTIAMAMIQSSLRAR